MAQEGVAEAFALHLPFLQFRPDHDLESAVGIGPRNYRAVARRLGIGCRPLRPVL